MHWCKFLSAGLFLSYASHVSAAQDYVVPPMVTIPAGKFIMGSEKASGGELTNSPAHEVTLKAFQLSKYEVTVGEFRQFVADTGHDTKKTTCWIRKKGTKEIEMAPGSWDSPQYAPTDFHPVMCIGADDATAYMSWLSKKTGNTYRFPTEAEWEYAARAGSKDDYFFGNDENKLCQYGNVFDKSGERAFKRDLGTDWKPFDCDDNVEYTATVGMYKPNAFGLFDMLGNVAEFTADCEHLDYTGAPSDGSAWTTGCHIKQITHEGKKITFDPMIIRRGGNYGNEGWAARIFARGHAGFTNASSLGEGFRLAQDVAPARPEQVTSTRAFLRELALAQGKAKLSPKK